MFTSRTLFEGSSDYSQYRVVETLYAGRRARLLYGGHNTPQSGVALDSQANLLFDYNQRFLEIAQSVQPSSVLVIGGGAFTLPKELIERFPATTVDVVELDALLPVLAHRYFDLPQDPRLKVIVQDGRTFIEESDASYDLIIVDAFSEFIVPIPLYSVGAVKQYARLLRPDGVLAMNFIAKYKGTKKTLAHELVATFCTEFAAISLYPADHTYYPREEQNILLVASHSPEVALDYLHSESVQLDVMPDDAIVADPI